MQRSSGGLKFQDQAADDMVEVESGWIGAGDTLHPTMLGALPSTMGVVQNIGIVVLLLDIMESAVLSRRGEDFQWFSDHQTRAVERLVCQPRYFLHDRSKVMYVCCKTTVQDALESALRSSEILQMESEPSAAASLKI